jgi:hypothetical protein
MLQDPVVDIALVPIIDKIALIEPQFKLIYKNKKLSSQQKRIIRKAFNQLKPEIIRRCEHEMLNVLHISDYLLHCKYGKRR